MKDDHIRQVSDTFNVSDTLRNEHIVMFTREDFDILKQPGSWEKVQAVQAAFSPKLLALQIEANKLIHQIYGIEVNKGYNISQMPTVPSRKGQPYNAKRRIEDGGASAGLRAKGVPINLTKPDGKLCEIHGAWLNFLAWEFQEEATLSIYFAPYGAKYESFHREILSKSIILHEIAQLLIDFSNGFIFSEKLPFYELLLKHGSFLHINPINPCSNNYSELARLEIIYAASFPMLDLFTRWSNGDAILKENGEQYDALNEPNYAALFREWHAKHADDYIKNFHVEPVTETDIWQSEARTRAIFEDLFGRTFPKLRPAWLKSGKNSSLELDGYCEELKLAFEYQGEYHYMDIPVHHQQRTLKEVQQNDELKAKLCRKQGVSLIQMPYWEKGNIGWIVEAVNALNRPELQLKEYRYE